MVKQSPQPAFNRKFDRLITYLNENHEKGYQNIISCASLQQAERLNAIFEEMEQTVHYKTVVQPLFEGFEDIEAKIAVLPIIKSLSVTTNINSNRVTPKSNPSPKRIDTFGGGRLCHPHRSRNWTIWWLAKDRR